MKVVIFTQVYENYAWREDGTLGTGTEAYWKAKGGDEYVVTGIWDEDELTPFEQDQLEYEGRITYPAKVIEWA